jgi:hypothetical protein
MHGPICTVLSWFTVRSWLQRKNQIQIFASHRNKRMARLCGWHSEAPVELREVLLAQKFIRPHHTLDPMHPLG